MRTALLAFLLVSAVPAATGPSDRGTVALEAARDTRPWSFAVLGDNRDDPDAVFPAIVRRISDDAELAFAIHLGDMTRSGSEAQLRDFMDSVAPIRALICPVIGNHDIRRDKHRRKFKAAFGLKGTSYSFSYDNAHFVVVDNASQELSPGVLSWLRADLEAHKKGTRFERLFVAMHIPPAVPGVTTHGAGDKAAAYESGSRALMELLRQYAVDVVLAGHVHEAAIVDASIAPRIVISGAAGAPQGGRPPKYGYHRVTVS